MLRTWRTHEDQRLAPGRWVDVTRVFIPVDLDRTRDRLTRYQSRQIRNTFPFLKLPPEIRNIIYELCLSFKGIEVFFHHYHKNLVESCIPHFAHVPKHAIRIPTIFRLNRQIFNEAVHLISKQTVRFDHGLLDIRGVREVISESALRRISTLHITTNGHPTLDGHILRESWLGYIYLLRELANILAKGHSLRKLVVDLSDKGLAEHTGRCWYQPIVCDYRDQLKTALNGLRKIRGVRDVEIKGIDATFAAELKKVMQSKRTSFMSLPGEVRNMIYDLAADWSDINVNLATVIKNWTDQNIIPPYPKRTTPTILLLNKTIHAEASAILVKKPLNIIFPKRKFKREAHVPNILFLITLPTLTRVKHLNVRVESWEWMFALGQMLPALARKHSLRSFQLTFHDAMKGLFMKAADCPYPDATVHRSLAHLTLFRGIESVRITGDLPTVYAGPLARSMSSAVGEVDLPVLQAICANGRITDVMEDEEEDEEEE